MSGFTPQLIPSPHRLGVFNSFLAQQTESLILRERIAALSTDNFDIKLVNGTPLLHCHGEKFSLSQRKIVSNMAGNPIFTIRKEFGFGPQSYYAEDPSGGVFLEVKGKWSFGGPKATGQFHNPGTDRIEHLSMKGDFFSKTAEIVNDSTGQVVAVIDRQWSARQFFVGAQTYTLTVAQNVDLALMVAMCICLDERRQERQ